MLFILIKKKKKNVVYVKIDHTFFFSHTCNAIYHLNIKKDMTHSTNSSKYERSPHLCCL